jgi:hypothetical protein
MMKTKLLLLTGAVAIPFAAQAGSLTVPSQDITLSGGIAGAYFYNTDTKRDAYAVTDALIDLSTEAKPNAVSFDVGIGALAMNNLATSGGPLTAIGGDGTDAGSVAVQYGWISVMPVGGLKVDVGKLATNVGYEVAPGYGDANILRGLVWNAQPVYYTGARATYSMGGINVYAEANKNAAGSGAGSAAGVNGSIGGINAALNVASTVNVKSIVDVILSAKLGGIDVAANIDYQTLAKAARTAGTDDNAYAAALYASFPMGAQASLPVRVEYVSDGTSGIYGLGAAGASNTAWTFTVTPTYNFSDSTFVRAEVALVTADKKSTYADDKGALTDSNLIVGFQGGVRF